MLCGTSGAVAAMDRAYMSLRARKPQNKPTSEQSSPFRRWTTGSGAGSYRHHDHRNIYNKQMSEAAAPACGGGGVARWSLGLEQLLADPAGAAAFAHFLHNEFAAENIRFWWSCEQYNASADEAERAALAQQIWSRHLADGAPEPVNVDSSARKAAAVPQGQPPPRDLFHPCQKQIFNVMKFDSYPRFLRSAVHAECARADLRGQPQPYLPRASPDATPTKLKKSTSNVSERRRSGGASLLPWKIRAVSKDRAGSACSEQPPAQESEPVADVVKSTTTGAPGCSLCRVVLPDGATSVVGVDEHTPVRRLVDRLLQRRNLLCTSYDVLLRDGQGEPSHVDTLAPSTVLGGREALVERRCVVRIELKGRCVAVRCRPARRLRHALRPVLQRYKVPAEATVLRDSTTVHMDTLMQELDGARLQIIAPDEEFPPNATPIAEDEADSLSELALRLNDDCESQSGISSTSRSECGSLSGATGSRVRAALIPGASLHHHPPDFLENLRATQRVRLQNRSDGGGGFEPRSPPPPLPPKPRTAPQAASIV